MKCSGYISQLTILTTISKINNQADNKLNYISSPASKNPVIEFLFFNLTSMSLFWVLQLIDVKSKNGIKNIIFIINYFLWT